MKSLRLWILAGLSLAAAAAEPVALRHAHAHNDYEHDRPLWEALEAGFTSVEADVHWIDGELRVAHSREQARPGRTLKALYLEPLRNLIRTNAHRVNQQRPEFFLMLDYKAEAGSAALELHRAVTNELAAYREILTEVRDSQRIPGPVTVVLSGERPEKEIAAERRRWWAIDGQLPDLQQNAPSHLVPWISTSWRPTFTWTGRDEFPADQRERLRQLVAQAHAQGRLLRFWGAPDHLDFWRGLKAEGVDLINTDKLTALATFLKTTPEP